MRHIKTYRVFESLVSKSQLVDKIKWYSNWLERYMMDYNKFTTSNLNFSFSYGTHLTIYEIFRATEKLSEDISDGLIRGIANEFITWSNHFILGDWCDRNHNRDIILSGNFHQLLPDSDIMFLEKYTMFIDEMKLTHKWELYNDSLKTRLYVYIGSKIKLLISGTEWDIPSVKEMTPEDEEFLIDAIESDLPVNQNWLEGVRESGLYFRTEYGHPMLTLSCNIHPDSDFIWRVGSYFQGVLVINNYKICFPFLRLKSD